jgi:hypothetical protein
VLDLFEEEAVKASLGDMRERKGKRRREGGDEGVLWHCNSQKVGPKNHQEGKANDKYVGVVMSFQ